MLKLMALLIYTLLKKKKKTTKTAVGYLAACSSWNNIKGIWRWKSQSCSEEVIHKNLQE